MITATLAMRVMAWDKMQEYRYKREFSPWADIRFEKHCLELKRRADNMRELNFAKYNIERWLYESFEY